MSCSNLKIMFCKQIPLTGLHLAHCTVQTYLTSACRGINNSDLFMSCGHQPAARNVNICFCNKHDEARLGIDYDIDRLLTCQ